MSSVTRDDVSRALGQHGSEATANEIATMLGHAEHGATREIVAHLNDMRAAGDVYRIVPDTANEASVAFWGLA